MIGRVLAFVACVALVAGEQCNGNGVTAMNGSDGQGGCCSGANHANQLQNAGTHSFPVAVFDAANSGFLATAGGFRISAKIHEAYWKNGGSALATTVDTRDSAGAVYTGLPKMEIACMGNACPTSKASDTNIADAPTQLTNCQGRLTRHFTFSQVSGTGSGNPSYVDDRSTANTFVYASVNVIQGATVYGETYTTSTIERVAIEVISFYFKFTKQIEVTATSTVTYAAVQINVVLTQSSVTTNDLQSFITLVNNAGTTCTPKSPGAGAGFCDVNPLVQLEVGITTITNLPFMTQLHMQGDRQPGLAPVEDADDDNFGNSGTVPFPYGIKVSAKDQASGLHLISGGAATQRDGHTHDVVPDQSGCRGTCATGSGNCDGSCALKYKAYLEYRRDMTGGTVQGNIYTPGDTDDENPANTKCQIVGAVLTVGNAGVNMGEQGGATTINFQEIQCRSKIEPSRYGPDGTDPDPSCPFAPDGQDADDNFSMTVTISTSNWCPYVIADNQVEGLMTTSHDSYFDGNRLDITVYVIATAAANGDTSLPINKVKWESLTGSCADGTADDCNVGGDDQGDARSTSVIHIIGGSITTLGQLHQAESCNSGSVTEDYATNVPYTCQITASVFLCQHAPWTQGGGCPAKNVGTTTPAFEIDEDHTSTKIVLTAEVKVGYEGIAIPARKRTIEVSQGVEKMWALLQNTEGTANAEVETGLSRAPTDELENVDQAPVDIQEGEEATVAVEEESNPMLIYIIVGVFLFISVFVGALVMYLRRSKGEKKQEHPVPITVEANKNTAAMA